MDEYGPEIAIKGMRSLLAGARVNDVDVCFSINAIEDDYF